MTPEDETLFASLLDEALDGREAGRMPDFAALRREYADQPAVIDRLEKALRRYDEFATREAPLPPGTACGDFVIETYLDRGGMAEVYRARQQSLGGRLVALKVLRAGHANDRLVRHFRREATQASKLHHKNLAEVYGFGELDDGSLFYAMRFVEGSTFQQILQRHRKVTAGERDGFSHRQVVTWMAEISSAVAHIHESGLIHRDIKPGNIMLDDGAGAGEDAASRAAVLVDLGLIQFIDPAERTQTLESSATPAYAAPEILVGREADTRSDVFSLGVTLHDLLCRRTPRDRIQASIGLEPLRELVPDVDRDLSAVVARAVEPERRWRYADAGILRDDLQAWLAGEPVSARRPDIRRVVGRFAQRQWRGVAASIAALVLLVALFLEVARLSAVSASGNEAFEAGCFKKWVEAVDVLDQSALGRQWLRGHLAAGRDADRMAEIRAITGTLLKGRHTEAFRDVATLLSRDGLADRPLLVRGYLTHLGSSFPEVAWRDVVEPIFRLFQERPVQVPADEPVAARFADRFLEIGSEDDPNFHSVMAVSAIGGAGQPRHIEATLDLVGAEQELEMRAAALRSASMIAQRAYRRGRFESVPPARTLLDKIATPLRESVLLDSEHQWIRLGGPWYEFLQYIAFGLRQSGTGVDESGYAPLIDILAERPGEAFMVASLRAAVRDPSLEPMLEEGSVPVKSVGDLRERAGNWGSLCGFYDDERVTAEARGRLSLLADASHPLADIEQHFEARWRSARDMLLREDVVTHLDEASTLGATSECDLAPMAMRLVEGDQARVLARWNAEFSRRRPGEEGWFKPLPDEDLLIARWNFTQNPPEVAGPQAVAEAAACLMAYYLEELESWASHWRLQRAGASELRLVFDDPVTRRSLRPQQLTLTLTGLAALRTNFPLQGWVTFDVVLNEIVVGRVTIAYPGSAIRRVSIPWELVVAGRNSLALRLAQESTTTLWLYEAWLEYSN